MEGKINYIVAGEKIDRDTTNILESMAEVPSVVSPVIVLPDIHYKLSYHTPTGVVVMTEGSMIPKFVNPNCGMSFIVTPFYAEEIDEDKLDKIFDFLRRHISVSVRLRPEIEEEDLEEIIVEGAGWAVERFGLDGRDLANFENNGSLLKGKGYSVSDVLRHIPESCRKMALVSMKVLGYGNHFIEMQKVDDVLNDEAAQQFGISSGQVCFMMHGDSRAFGRSVYDNHSKKSKKLMGLQQLYKKIHYNAMSSDMTPAFVKSALKSVNYHGNRMKSSIYWKLRKYNNTGNMEFPSIDAASEEGIGYMLSTYATINFGYANRATMASVIRDALREAFGKPDAKVRILCDGNHDALQEEIIDGRTYWAHRNGASRAMPASYYDGHPVFSVTGQPVLVPGSMGTDSFLCAAGEGSREAFYSAPHGAGRVMDRGQARIEFKDEDVIADLKLKGLRVYDYGGGNVMEESPKAFKDVHGVIDTVKNSGIAGPVARMKPLAVLKGWT